ncbi:hypothetical protein, partial [Paraburkholderia sp. BR14427]|uniref:hypothetical protein n=1 Tax=Paraburkholderia sp. BR14427 TaxID=3237008 RepID=UPI0034CD8422
MIIGYLFLKHLGEGPGDFLFRRVSRRLTDDDRTQLDRLLKREFNQRQTAYNAIKRYALRP